MFDCSSSPLAYDRNNQNLKQINHHHHWHMNMIETTKISNKKEENVIIIILKQNTMYMIETTKYTQLKKMKRLNSTQRESIRRR
jgi:hypothetical protein